MHSPAGQSAIRLRRALAHGDAAAAAELAPHLDLDHLVEILLGAALRDARGGYAAAQLYLDVVALAPADARDWLPLCTALATPGDATADDVAAAWVAAGRVPDVIPQGGRAISEAERAALATDPEVTLVALIADGASLDALLTSFDAHPLFPSVNAYYRGGIRAMGWRPLLLLGIVARR